MSIPLLTFFSVSFECLKALPNFKMSLLSYSRSEFKLGLHIQTPQVARVRVCMVRKDLVGNCLGVEMLLGILYCVTME